MQALVAEAVAQTGRRIVKAFLELGVPVRPKFLF